MLSFVIPTPVVLYVNQKALHLLLKVQWVFFQSKKNYEPQRKLGHRKRVKVNELDKLMLAKIMLSAEWVAFCYRVVFPKDPLSVVFLHPTQNSATVQSSFWVFLIIESEFKWNKRVTCFFLCCSWQAANCKNHLFPPLRPLCQRTGWRWPRTTQLPPPTRVVGFFFQCKKEKNNNRVLQSRHEISIWVHQGYCQIPATSLTETNPPPPNLFFLLC